MPDGVDFIHDHATFCGMQAGVMKRDRLKAGDDIELLNRGGIRTSEVERRVSGESLHGLHAESAQ
jgi:hypothetical protein